MSDRQQEQPQAEAEAEAANSGTGLVAYRRQWGRDSPRWEVTADLEPLPEADMF